MTEPTFDEMCWQCWRHYVKNNAAMPEDWPSNSAALVLLRTVGQRVGWHVNIKVNGSVPGKMGDAGWLYMVWVGNKEACDMLPSELFGARTLGEAAIRFAYACIPKGENNG